MGLAPFSAPRSPARLLPRAATIQSSTTTSTMTLSAALHPPPLHTHPPEAIAAPLEARLPAPHSAARGASPARPPPRAGRGASGGLFARSGGLFADELGGALEPHVGGRDAVSHARPPPPALGPPARSTGDWAVRHSDVDTSRAQYTIPRGSLATSLRAGLARAAAVSAAVAVARGFSQARPPTSPALDTPAGAVGSGGGGGGDVGKIPERVFRVAVGSARPLLLEAAYLWECRAVGSAWRRWRRDTAVGGGYTAAGLRRLSEGRAVEGGWRRWRGFAAGATSRGLGNGTSSESRVYPIHGPVVIQNTAHAHVRCHLSPVADPNTVRFEPKHLPCHTAGGPGDGWALRRRSEGRLWARSLQVGRPYSQSYLHTAAALHSY